MKLNLTFEKSLVLLTHPVSLTAVGLMLLNDQILRRLFPSWWTGKFSDFAWLFIVPFVAAAVLAWLVPGKSRTTRHETWTFALAFGLTGIGFVLVKAVPAVNLLATRILTTTTGASPALRLDPSDLLTLPALAASAWLWHSTRGGTLLLPNPLRAARTLVILPVVLLVLLADAAAPDPGITCFTKQGSQIYARGGYSSSFVSQDGGKTWEAVPPSTPVECTQKNGAMAAEWVEAPGPQTGTLYRYIPDQEIQVSTDDGKNWETGMKFNAMTEAERFYYMKSRRGSPIINPGPLDAIADPATGNMLFAMGQQGILVHTADGEWQWSQGGTYQRPEAFPSTDALLMLLGGMAFLAIGAVLLLYSTLAMRWTKHWVRIVVLVLAWLAWLGVVGIFSPAATYSYSNAFSGMGILALAVLIVPLAIEQTVRLVRRAPRELPRLLGLGLAGGLLFFLPYVFWVYDVLPDIQWTTVVALVLTIAILAAGWIILMRKKPQTRDKHPVG